MSTAVETPVSAPVYSLEETDSPEENAHYVRPPQDWPGTGSDFLAFCMANDLEMTALCGYVWKPSRVPFGMPVCKTCVDIATNALTGGGAA